MASLAIALELEALRRKPPASAQYNWLRGDYETVPEQLDLGLPPLEDAVLPHDNTVTLLATESGAQLFVSGFGLYIGKKSERVVVKKNGKACAQVPFMRMQELIVASRRVSS